MSKPKIFQQMESAGSFWITDDNKNTVTFQNIIDKFNTNIPVYYVQSLGTNNKQIYFLISVNVSATENSFFLFSNFGEDIVETYTFSTRDINSTIGNSSPTTQSIKITNKTGDTMEGSLLAKAGIANSRQMRNITLSTAEPSSGENGDVWIQYEG